MSHPSATSLREADTNSEAHLQVMSSESASLDLWQKVGNVDRSSSVSHNRVGNVQSKDQSSACVEFEHAADIDIGLGAVGTFSGKKCCARSAHTKRITAE